MKILNNPLTATELATYPRGPHGSITAVIRMDLDTFTDGDLDSALNDMTDRISAEALLTDISYNVVGVEPDNILLIKVTGIPLDDDDA